MTIDIKFFDLLGDDFIEGLTDEQTFNTFINVQLINGDDFCLPVTVEFDYAAEEIKSWGSPGFPEEITPTLITGIKWDIGSLGQTILDKEETYLKEVISEAIKKSQVTAAMDEAFAREEEADAQRELLAEQRFNNGTV